MNRAKVVIEVIGEGRSDVGPIDNPNESSQPEPPKSGIVPILVHTLCGKPAAMLVKRRPYSVLEGKTRAQKVQFAKRQSLHNHSAGMVFVFDSEGDLNGRTKELTEGRDREHREYPAAVGVAPSLHRSLASGRRAGNSPSVRACPRHRMFPLTPRTCRRRPKTRAQSQDCTERHRRMSASGTRQHGEG